jgi:hypothetical protein
MRVIDIINFAYYQIKFWGLEIDRGDELIASIGNGRRDDTAEMVYLSAFADRTADQPVPSQYDDG